MPTAARIRTAMTMPEKIPPASRGSGVGPGAGVGRMGRSGRRGLDGLRPGYPSGDGTNRTRSVSGGVCAITRVLARPGDERLTPGPCRPRADWGYGEPPPRAQATTERDLSAMTASATEAPTTHQR